MNLVPDSSLSPENVPTGSTVQPVRNDGFSRFFLPGWRVRV
jgi:hypothetical protein